MIGNCLQLRTGLLQICLHQLMNVGRRLPLPPLGDSDTTAPGSPPPEHRFCSCRAQLFWSGISVGWAVTSISLVTSQKKKCCVRTILLEKCFACFISAHLGNNEEWQTPAPTIIRFSCFSDHVSIVKLRTKLICDPKLRCTPEHSRQKNIPSDTLVV